MSNERPSQRMWSTPAVIIRPSDRPFDTRGNGVAIIRPGPRPPIPPEIVEAVRQLAERKRADRETAAHPLRNSSDDGS
jgi:hypothetical protein